MSEMDEATMDGLIKFLTDHEKPFLMRHGGYNDTWRVFNANGHHYALGNARTIEEAQGLLHSVGWGIKRTHEAGKYLVFRNAKEVQIKDVTADVDSAIEQVKNVRSGVRRLSEKIADINNDTRYKTGFTNGYSAALCDIEQAVQDARKSWIDSANGGEVRENGDRG